MLLNNLLQFVSNDKNVSYFKTLIQNSRNHKTHDRSIDRNEKLEKKVAIVTGASSGIGKALAHALARERINVVLAARNEEKLEAVRKEITDSGGSAISVPTDVTDEQQCKALVNTTLRAFGQIDILINNAGISMRANFKDLDLEVLKRLMDVNFWGMVYCTKYTLSHIIENKGSIIGISSICGITPLPGRTGYSASKHAMDGFLESLRIENSVDGIHVMIVHPGFTESNIRNVALNRFGMPQRESPLEEVKLMPAESVAKVIITGIKERKRNIILTTKGRLITWIYRRAPRVADRLIFREMAKESGSPF